MSEESLQQIRIILVEPSHPGNIGAVARAMKTMGLKQLCLVNPKEFPSKVATERAAGADDILHQANCFDSLEQALADCEFVLGTSARPRSLTWSIVTPKEAGTAVAQAPNKAKVAIVFGRENSGLNNEELQRCHKHIFIPASSEYSSLNLAQAVQIICYEVRMAVLEIKEVVKEKVRFGDMGRPVTNQELEGMLEHLEETLKAIKFLNPTQPRKLMSRMRRIYQKAELDDIELNILRGIFAHTLKEIEEVKS